MTQGGSLGKRCLFSLTACYPEIRLPGDRVNQNTWRVEYGNCESCRTPSIWPGSRSRPERTSASAQDRYIVSYMYIYIYIYVSLSLSLSIYLSLSLSLSLSLCIYIYIYIYTIWYTCIAHYVYIICRSRPERTSASARACVQSYDMYVYIYIYIYIYISFFWLGESSTRIVVAPEVDRLILQRLWMVWPVTRSVWSGEDWTQALLVHTL